MDFKRRDLSLVMPLMAAWVGQGKSATGSLPGRGYEYTELPVKNNGQNKSRDVFKGVAHSGLPVDLHITELAPGAAPHPPHHHVHEEIVMIRSGSLEVTISGKTALFGPGSVIYAASGEEHGWKNPGTDRAEYFVLALGRDT